MPVSISMKFDRFTMNHQRKQVDVKDYSYQVCCFYCLLVCQFIQQAINPARLSVLNQLSIQMRLSMQIRELPGRKWMQMNNMYITMQMSASNYITNTLIFN